jgi:hypothetical protein
VLSVVGTILLLSLAPAFSEWRITTLHQPSLASPTSSSSSPLSIGVNDSSLASSAVTPVWWLSSPTSYGQSILFLGSSAYFALDIVALHLRHRLSSSKGQRILTHHLLSIVGLTSPIFSGLDGPLVLLGFVLAECSNPPFHVLTLCKYATKSNMRLRCASTWLKRLAKPVLYVCLSMDLSLVHVLIFVLTRLACLQFTAHAVMPFANLLTTKVTSIILCLLSALMFLDLCKTLQLGESTAPGTAKKAHGWKHVVAELRELQSECDSATPTSEGEEAEQNGRKRGRGSGSAVNSPRQAQVAPVEDDPAAAARKAHIKRKLFW